jgi:hypothetical protein
MWVTINLQGHCTIHSSESDPIYNRLQDKWQNNSKIDAPDGTFELFEQVTHKPMAILVERVNSSGKSIVIEHVKIH